MNTVMLQTLTTFFACISCLGLVRAIVHVQFDPDEETQYSYEQKYIEQPLDHFGFANSSTFKQRYLVNDSYFSARKGGPIFFYTGNEGDVEAFAQNSGFIWDIAPEFGALVVFAEHRYYGRSNPFGNLSYTKNPHLNGYLTSEQALADFAQLVKHLKGDIKGASTSPVIAFGGSYGGMLAAWFRIKYPHLCDGAIAASAPIAQFEAPCETFGRIVTSDYRRVHPSCSNLIRKSWNDVTAIGSKAEGLAWLSSEFKLCKPMNDSSQVQGLKDYLNDLFTNVAMMDYPYPTNFLSKLPGNPVKVVCKRMLNFQPNETLDDAHATVQRLVRGAEVFYNYTGKTKCLNTGLAGGIDVDLWDVQTCNEMVMPICFNGRDDMFEPAEWNFDKFSKNCYEKWGTKPRKDQCEVMYGAKKLRAASNIVFSNGMLDPWASGGVIEDINKSVIAIIIPEGAHHLDLRGSNPKDPTSVITARKLEKRNIRQWIAESKKNMKRDMFPVGPNEKNFIV